MLEKTDAIGQDSFTAPNAPVAGNQHVDVELAEAAKRLCPRDGEAVAGERWTTGNEIADEGNALARQVDDRVAACMPAPEIKNVHDARAAREPKRPRKGQVREDELEAS